MSIKIIKEVTVSDLKKFIYDIDLEDQNLYKEANNPNMIGVFQLTSSTSSKILKEVRPKNFSEICAISSLSRPGTIEFVPDYMRNKETGSSKYPKIISDLLKDTHGICIYQEQIMEIFNKIGGFSLDSTNYIRALMKKLGKKEKKQEDVKAWNIEVERFKKGAKEKGISDKESEEIADDLLRLSSYSFNKCFSGDMVIDKDNSNSWNPTIEEMYLAMNNVKWAKENGHQEIHYKYRAEGYMSGLSLKEDGLLFKNKIKNITHQGIRKVFKITLENGKNIEVTSNHKFPVFVNGKREDKTIDSGLSIEDFLITNDNYGATKFEEVTTSLSRIVSIAEVGEKNTYDVEMDAPYHTVSVNGVVANNSHAVSYSYIGMMNLYLSFYFRKYYYASVLSYEVDRDKSIAEVFKLVKNQGFKISPPNVNESDYKIFPSDKDKELVYGLIDIKGVGDKAIPAIVENRPYKDLFDFYLKTQGKGVNATVIKSLICSGAFDFYDKNRTKLYNIFLEFVEKKKSKKDPATLSIIFKEAEKNNKDVKTTNQEMIEYEKNFLGANIFTSIFSDNLKQGFKELEKKGLIKTNIVKASIGANRFPVVINRKHEIIDKNGNPMCFIEFEDMYGNKDSIPVFSSNYKHIEPFKVNSIYLISLYNKDDKLMFGVSNYEDNPEKIKRFVKEVVQKQDD